MEYQRWVYPTKNKINLFINDVCKAWRNLDTPQKKNSYSTTETDWFIETNLDTFTCAAAFFSKTNMSKNEKFVFTLFPEKNINKSIQLLEKCARKYYEAYFVQIYVIGLKVCFRLLTKLLTIDIVLAPVFHYPHEISLLNRRLGNLMCVIQAISNY